MLDARTSSPRLPRATTSRPRPRPLARAAEPSPTWLVILILGATGIAVYYQLPRAGVAQGIGMNLANLLPLVTCTFAIRKAHRADRLAWTLIGVSILFTLVANIGYYGQPLVTHRPLPFPSWVDVFWLGTYPFFVAALIVLGRRQDDGDRLGRVLDTLIITSGGLMLLWSFVLGPELDHHGMTSFAHTVSLAYPVMDMLVFAAVVRLIVGAPRDPALYLLVGSFIALLAADTTNAVQLTNGTYRYGGPCDGLWAASYVILAAAALYPRLISRGRSTRPVIRLRPGRFAFLTIGGAVGPVLLTTRPDDLAFLGTAAVATFLAVMGRTGLINMHLIRAGERATDQAERLRHQALHDALTGLANRSLIVLRLEALLSRCARTDHIGAALDIDVDGFTNINDTLGHSVGDQLLQAVAVRIAESVPEADTVGRVGSDEYVVLLEATSTDDAERVAERVRAAIRQPLTVAALTSSVSITACIGVAATPSAGADELLRHVDIALGRARATGRDRQHTFHPTMRAEVLRRGELELDVHAALAGGQLRLVYQPVRKIDGLGLAGFEALLRWQHPSYGTVSPVEFIPLLEATGQIVEVGRWVLRTACQQAAAWAASMRPSPVSVNISARQLDDDLIVDHVAEVLALTKLEPALLTLEITETTLMHNPREAARRLRALKALGVRLAIDDFGTGYSSLAYLQRFPVDCLKIDRTFVANIGTSADADALLHLFVQLAGSLNLCTIAEGVETRGQLDVLRREGVDAVQGFLFAKPLSAASAERVLDAGAAAR